MVVRLLERPVSAPGSATLYVVPGVTLLRPSEVVAEQMLAGFVDH